ncbi:efflux RND transporter periplasmic adaptor subunit [Thermobispora bispora]|uniref:efflux RND transporter periplasmic adaptor subunit n=1 Tax=Thermobispora bispora TaxID=2006 RepID=UPI00197D1037|nr:HlyD family efflux transporter periplasmic adaptor subunit [Thermobispora bispora]QSI46424.1 HlyD family efflux transporter periplasmic adaptor subunit [Thermobispora bispora]QSI49530.1 HlyD family efflux transporter periplasmic adaptor subunit [Thermobispora bispora]
MKPSTKRRTLIVNGVLAVLLIAGIGGVVISLRGGSAAESTPPTARVTRGNVTATVSASGSVASARERSLGFGTTGTVEKIYVKAGDRVRKGQVLARLDDTAARESLEAAKASLEAAAAGDTSTAQGHAQYISARNAYRAAKRTLAGTVIKAPFAGIVTAVNGSEGGSASGGAGGASTGSGGQQAGGASSGGFIELADPNRLQIVGSFTESDVTKIKKGQRATVTFAALPGVTPTGKVTLIDPQPQTSNNVVRYAVTISLTDVPSEVRLGQTASVQVVVGEAENVLTVPTSAIRTAGGQSTVTVIENGSRVVRRVEVGLRGDSTTEIRSGLLEGELVVRFQAANQANDSSFPRFGGGPMGGGPAGGGPAGRLGGGLR